MGLRYKIDVIAALKSRGITTYTILREGLLSQSTVQKLRTGEGVSWSNLERLCRLLGCQPGDILEYVEETPEA